MQHLAIAFHSVMIKFYDFRIARIEKRRAARLARIQQLEDILLIRLALNLK